MSNDYNNNAEPMWSNFETMCRKNAATVLGVSKGGLNINKDPTWWNDDVKQVVKAKRDLFKLWQKTQLEEDRIGYKEAKKLAKCVVAQSIAQSKESLYKIIEDAKNDAEVFKLAK